MMRALVAFLRDTRAAAAVEMALVMPILFALSFTTFEAGNYLLTEQKVIEGVRQGARYAGRLPFEYYTACNGTLNDVAGEPTAAARLAEIQNITRTGDTDGDRNNDGNDDPRIKDWANSDVTVTVTCTDLTTTGADQGLYGTTAGQAPRVLVSSVVEYPAILGLLGFDTDGAIVRAQAEAPVTGQ